MDQLWTMGYGAWPAPRRAEGMVGALRDRGVTRLVDIRLNPCSADTREGRYGPKPWTLQAGPGGIVALLKEAGIGYEWLVELGNPQRQDRSMRVLREHLGDAAGGWPVARGLARLAELVRSRRAIVAVLCACADVRACHRAVVARALSEREFAGRLVVREVKTGEVVR